jgi:DNA-binding NtrC family response regulator
MDKHARILVVDDDVNIRKTMEAILSSEGYTVDLAEDGKEAIRKSESATYNIALIDIRLPDMDGVELLTRMKDTVPRTRKIIITGYPSVQNAIEAVNRKADTYLVKPVDLEKLLIIIETQLELQKKEKKYSEEKVVEFIKARVKEINST